MKNCIITLIISALAASSAMAITPHKNTYKFAEKSGQELYLDHYISPVEGERGCVVFLFGGAFIKGVRDNSAYDPYFKYLTEIGYDVFSIDYRLGLKQFAEQGITPSMREAISALNSSIKYAVEDLYSATLFIMDHAQEWKINTHRIVISGSSAGAIAVLQAENELCNKSELSSSLPEGFRYAGVISFAGAIFNINNEPKWQRTPAPMMLFHGNSDNQVPYKKATILGTGFYGSQYIANQLKKKSAPYWFYTTKHADHEMAVTPMHTNLYQIGVFLKDFVENGEKESRITTVSDTAIPKRKTSFRVKDYLNANYGI